MRRAKLCLILALLIHHHHFPVPQGWITFAGALVRAVRPFLRAGRVPLPRSSFFLVFTWSPYSGASLPVLALMFVRLQLLRARQFCFGQGQTLCTFFFPIPFRYRYDLTPQKWVIDSESAWNGFCVSSRAANALTSGRRPGPTTIDQQTVSGRWTYGAYICPPDPRDELTMAPLLPEHSRTPKELAFSVFVEHSPEKPGYCKFDGLRAVDRSTCARTQLPLFQNPFPLPLPHLSPFLERNRKPFLASLSVTFCLPHSWLLGQSSSFRRVPPGPLQLLPVHTLSLLGEPRRPMRSLQRA